MNDLCLKNITLCPHIQLARGSRPSAHNCGAASSLFHPSAPPNTPRPRNSRELTHGPDAAITRPLTNMAPWPFNSAKKDEPPPWAAYFSADDPRQLVVPTALSTVGILGLVAFYRRFLRRIPGTAYIKPTSFRSRTLLGRVTSVGDGDGFHLYHTPGGRLAGWGWLRRIPSTRAALKNQTV